MGWTATYELLNVGFAVSAVASENGVYQAGRESRFGYGYELFEKENVMELAGRAGNTAVELLKAKTPKGGEMPVLLDQELAGVFAHEAVGHASEADLVLEGDSILENRIGEQIASPLVTIIDDPTLHEFGYYPFDAEGVQSRRTEIIKRRNLQFLSSLQRNGCQTRGNTRELQGSGLFHAGCQDEQYLHR